MKKVIGIAMARLVFILTLSSLILCSSGCEIMGLVANAMPPEEVKPKYIGFAHQSVGVMIWADRGLRIDWPNLQLDLANAIEKQLKENPKTKQFEGSVFSVRPESIVRYQKDHPETDAMSPTEIAPMLGVTRLIYVELDDFTTRSDMSVELFRGDAKATVHVIEVDKGVNGGPNGPVAKTAFEQANVEATYPPKSPREGMLGLGDVKTYNGTVDAFATQVAHLFVPWTPEEHESEDVGSSHDTE